MSRTFAQLLLLTALLITLPACSLLPWHGGDRTHTGTYSWGFEVSEFRKCNASDKWWVTGSAGEELVAKYRSLRNDTMYQQIYVRLRGTVSETGQYGHLGAYTNEFEVTEVIESRNLRPGECQ